MYDMDVGYSLKNSTPSVIAYWNSSDIYIIEDFSQLSLGNSGFGFGSLFSINFKLDFYCREQQIGLETMDNIGMRKGSIGVLNT